MGAYVWGTQELNRRKKLETRLHNAVWHALFWMGAAFGLGSVLSMSFESRGGFGPLSGAGGGLAMPVFLSLGAGAWSFWRGYSEGRSTDVRHRLNREDLEWGETIFSAVLLAAFLMYFILQAFKIPSGSMRSTLEVGDHLFVNKFLYGVRIPLTEVRLGRFRKVQRGDIAVFEFPTDDPKELHCGSVQTGKDFIKRVIGVPGDVIEVKNGNLLVNGAVQEEPYTQYVDSMRIPPPSSSLDPEPYQTTWQTRRLDKTFGDRVRDFFGPVRVPEGSYFMMGDNRDQSCDSRFWGPVQDRFVKGKAWFVYWPIGRMRTLR
jgi:signal peptidase I